jgi:hypothetical protein
MGRFMRPLVAHEIGSGHRGGETREKIGEMLGQYTSSLNALNNQEEHRNPKITIKCEKGDTVLTRKHLLKYIYLEGQAHNNDKLWKVGIWDLHFRSLDYIFDQTPNVRDKLFRILKDKEEGDVWRLRENIGEGFYRSEWNDDFTDEDLSNIINDMIRENTKFYISMGGREFKMRVGQIWLMCKSGFTYWITY